VSVTVSESRQRPETGRVREVSRGRVWIHEAGTGDPDLKRFGVGETYEHPTSVDDVYAPVVEMRGLAAVLSGR
jgi:hypothetical protein